MCWSVRVAQRLSSSCRLVPSPAPQRTEGPLSRKGACDMLSAPPASATSLSPSCMLCAPLTTLWKPEPHSRFTVSAGTSCGTSALSATCRAMYGPLGSVCATLPKKTESMISGRPPACAMAARAATAPSSVAVRPLSVPPKVPKAVRLAATINTSRRICRGK